MESNRFYISLFGDVDERWVEWRKGVEIMSDQLQLPLRFFQVYRETAQDKRKKALKLETCSPSKLGSTIHDDSTIEWISFYAVPEQFSSVDAEWEAFFIREAPDYSTGSIFLGCQSRFMSQELLLPLINQLLKHIRVKYGFGELVSEKQAPYLHAQGTTFGRYGQIIDGGEDGELQWWLRDLFGDERRFERGYFRGAYPLQILSPAHLQQPLIRPLGHLCLQEAIESGAVPGKLTALEGGVALWKIEEADVEAVQELLVRNRLLV